MNTKEEWSYLHEEEKDGLKKDQNSSSVASYDKNAGVIQQTTDLTEGSSTDFEKLRDVSNKDENMESQQKTKEATESRVGAKDEPGSSLITAPMKEMTPEKAGPDVGGNLEENSIIACEEASQEIVELSKKMKDATSIEDEDQETHLKSSFVKKVEDESDTAIHKETRKDETSNASDINEKEIQEGKNLSTADFDEKTRSAELEIPSKNGNELYVTHPPVEEKVQVGDEEQDEFSIPVSGHQVHEALEVSEEEKHVNETYEASKSPENTLLEHTSTEEKVNMEVTSTRSVVDINIEKGCELKSEEKSKENNFEENIEEVVEQKQKASDTEIQVETKFQTEKETKNEEHIVRDTEKAILEQEDCANNIEGGTKEVYQIKKAPLEFEEAGYNHGSEASEIKSVSTHTEEKREVEDKELTSNLSNKTVNEVHPEDKKEAGSWLSQPLETIKSLETENMPANILGVANVNIVDEGNVGTIEGELFSKSTSVTIGKTTKNTEENQLITKEETRGFAEEEEEQKGQIITDENIIVEASYGKNTGIIIQTTDLTEDSSINIEKLREDSNEESMDNASGTKTTSSDLNSRETSFEGEHKTSNTSSNSMGTVVDPEKIQPSTNVEDENKGEKMLYGGIKDVCTSNETTCQDNPKAEEPTEISEGAKDNLGSALLNAPVEKTSFTKVVPEACKNLEENSSAACNEESEETAKLSEKMKGAPFIEDEVQNKLQSSFLNIVEETCFQKVDNLETSKEESETGIKDIDNERQNEADDNEILENITTAESNLSTPGKDDENPDQKADDSFRKPEESMIRESEDSKTTEALTMECKHGGVMAVAGEDNVGAEVQEKTETSLYEEHSEQSFMQKTEPAKEDLGSLLDGTSEEIETTVPDEYTETITNIEQQGPVGSPEEILGETRKDETTIANDTKEIREAKDFSTVDLDEKTRSAEFEIQNKNGNQLYVTHLPIEEKVQVECEKQDEVSMSELGDQFQEALESPKEEAKHVNETHEASKNPECIILEHVSTEGAVNTEMASTTCAIDIKLEKSCELNPEEKLEEVNAKENVKEDVEQKEEATDAKFEIVTKSDVNEKSTAEDSIPLKNSTSSCTGEEEYPHDQDDKIRPNSSKEGSPELDSGDQSWRISNDIKNFNDQIINEEVYEDPKIADGIKDTEKQMKNEHTVTDCSSESTGEHPTKSCQENETEANNRKAEIGEEVETTSEGQSIEKQVLAEENRVQDWSTVPIREELDIEGSKEEAVITEVSKEEVLEKIQTATGTANIGIQIKEEDGTTEDNFVASGGEEPKNECSYDEEKEEKEPGTLVPRETQRAAESEIIKDKMEEESRTKELHIIHVADETVSESLEETASNKNTEMVESNIAEDLNKESEASPMTKEIEEEIKKNGKPMDLSSSVSERSEENIKEENTKATENCDDEIDIAPTVSTEVTSLGEVLLNDEPVKALDTSSDTKSLQTTKTADNIPHDAKVESMNLEETSSMLPQHPVHEHEKADPESITVKKSVANDVEVEETKILEAVSESTDQSVEEFNERSTNETGKQIREVPEELSEATNQGVEEVSEDEIIAPTVATEVTSFGEVPLNDKTVKALDTSSGGKNLQATKTADTSQQEAEVDSVKLEEISIMLPQITIHEHEKARNENNLVEKSANSLEETKIPDAASKSKDQAFEEIHEPGTSLAVGETDSNEVENQIREVPDTLSEPINQGIDTARDDEITPSQTLQAEKIEEKLQVPSSCLLSEEQESETATGIKKERANDDAWGKDQELYRPPEMNNQKGISESDVELLKMVNTSEVANCSEIGKLDTTEDEESSYIGLDKEKSEYEMEKNGTSEHDEVYGGCIDTEKAIQEQEDSGKNFEGSSKESIEIAKASIEFEAEGHSHGSEGSETKSINTLTEEVPRETERAAESEIIKEQMIEEESCTNELHITPVADETVNEASLTATPRDVTSIRSLQETASNKNTEIMELEIAEDLNKESEASPMTKALEEEIKKVGKPEDISSSVSEENIEDTENCDDETDIAPTAITGVTSLGAVQLNDEPVKVTSPDTKSLQITKTADSSQQVTEVDSMKHEETSSMVSQIPVQPEKADIKSITIKKSAVNDVEVEASKILDAVSEPKDQSVKEVDERSTNLTVGETHTDENEKQIQEVPEELSEAINQGAEAVSEAETIAPTVAREATSLGEAQLNDEVDSVKLEDTPIMVSHPIHEHEKAYNENIVVEKSDTNSVEVEEVCELKHEEKSKEINFQEKIEGEDQKEKAFDAEFQKATESDDNEKCTTEEDIPVKNITPLGTGEEEHYHDQEDKIRPNSSKEASPELDVGDQSCRISNQINNTIDQIINEEVYEDPKTEDRDGDIENEMKNGEHTVTENLPESMGEHTTKCSQENETEAKKNKTEIGEELETTSEGQGVEKQVQAEESRVKDWSTVSVREELDTERSKEYAMMTKSYEEKVPTAGGYANIVIQTKEEDGATKDKKGTETDTMVLETNYGGQDSADQIVEIGVRDQFVESFQEKTVQESSQEAEVKLNASEASETFGARATMNRSANTDYPSSSVGEEKVEESLKEHKQDAMGSEKEVLNSNIECIESDFDATHSTEERKAKDLKDEAEPSEGLNTQSITGSSSEAAAQKESSLDLVENSLMPEKSEEEVKREIVEKEKVTVVTEETSLAEAEAGYITQADSSDLVSEEKGLVTTETSEAGLNVIDIIEKPAEISTLGVSKDVESPTARKHGADEAAEKTKPEGNNESCDAISETEDQRDIASVETSLDQRDIASIETSLGQREISTVETSMDHISETGTKDIDNERQNEADGSNEIVGNINTAESNLSTPGKDDENPERKADDSFRNPEKIMTREGEEIMPTEALTIERKREGVMAVASEENVVTEEQDKTETSKHEEYSEQSFMQKTEPAKENLGSALDVASEETETTVPDECTETLINIEEQRPVRSPKEILGETRMEETIIADDTNEEIREPKDLSTVDFDEKTRSAEFKIQNKNGNQLYVTHPPTEENVQVGGEKQNEVSMLELGDQFQEALEVPKEEAKHVNETYEASKNPESTILEHASTEGGVYMEVTSTTGAKDIKIEKSSELIPEEKVEEVNAKENVKEEVEQKEGTDTKFEIVTKGDDNKKSTLEEGVPINNSTSSCTGGEEYPHDQEDEIRPNSSAEASPELDSGDQSWRISNEIKNINDQIINEEAIQVYEDPKIVDRIEDTAKKMKKEHTVTDLSPESTGEHTTKCSQENETEGKSRKAESGGETTSECQSTEKQVQVEENRVQDWSTASSGEELDTESSKKDAMIIEVPKEEVLGIIQPANGSANIGIQTKEEEGKEKVNIVARGGEETENKCSYDVEEQKEQDTPVPRETDRAAESEIIKEETVEEQSCTEELHMITAADKTVNEVTIMDVTPIQSLEETASNINTELMESKIAEDLNEESEPSPMKKALEEEIKKVGKPMDVSSSVSEGLEEKIKEENMEDRETCDVETAVAPTVVTEVTSLGEIQLNDEPVKTVDTSSDSQSPQATKTADTSQHDAKFDSMKLQETSSMVSEIPVHEHEKEDTKTISVRKSAADDIEVEETKILDAVFETKDQNDEGFNERITSLNVGETHTNETEKQIREAPEELSEAINQDVEAVIEDEIIAPTVAREVSSLEEVQLSDEHVEALDTSSGGKNLETTKTADTSQQDAEVGSVKLEETSIMLPQLPIHEHETAYNENLTVEKSAANDVEVQETKIVEAVSESKDQSVDEFNERSASLSAGETHKNEAEKQIQEVPEELSEAINQGVETVVEDEIIAPTVAREVSSVEDVQLSDELVEALETSSGGKNLKTTKTADTSQQDAEVDSLKLEDTSIMLPQLPIHEHKMASNENITVEKSAANNVEVEETKILEAVSKSKEQYVEEFNERSTSLSVGETHTNEAEKQIREVPVELSEAKNQGVEAATEDEIIAQTVVREVSSLEKVQLSDVHIKALDTCSGGNNVETTKTADTNQQDTEVDSVKLEETSIMLPQLPIHEHEKAHNENIFVGKSDTNSVDVEETKNPDAASESKDQAFKEIHETGTNLTVGETDSNEIGKQIREVPDTLSECIIQGVDATRDYEISPSQTLQAEKIEEQLKLPSSCLLSEEQESDTAPGIEKTQDGSAKKDGSEVGNLKLEENSGIVSQLQMAECDSTNNTIINKSGEQDVEFKETETSDAVYESKDEGLEEIREIRTSPTSKYTETDKIEDEIKGVMEKISDPRYQGVDAAADGETLDHPLPVGKVEDQLEVSSSALFSNILETETRSTIEKIEDKSTKKDGTEVGKIELEEATGMLSKFPTTEPNICNMSANTEKSGSDEVQVEEAKTSEVISESKGHVVEEIHEIGPNSTVGKTHIDEVKEDIKAVPETIFDPNYQGAEAVIGADITINQTLTTQRKEQLQEPSSALLKEQNHETTSKVEIIKDENTKKHETQLDENVVGSFATNPTEKPCLQDGGSRELEVSNLEQEVQEDIQNKSPEEESTTLEKDSTAEPQEYSPEIKYADSLTEHDKRPTQHGSQENSTDEDIIYSEHPTKDVDNLTTPYPTVKEKRLTGEVGEKSEEASNPELEKTGEVPESVPEINSPEVPPISEGIEVIKEQLKGAISELRDGKNHFEEATEADEGMNKYTSQEKISEEKQVSRNSQPASPQEESIAKSNQEDKLREDYLGERTTIALQTPRNEIEQELFEESTEAGADKSKEAVTSDDRISENPCQVSVGDETANANLPEEAKDGHNIEKAPNKLEVENQDDEINIRDTDAATKATAPIKESTDVMLVSHEADRTRDNDEETVMSKDEKLENTDLAVPQVTDAAAKEAPDETVGENFDEFTESAPRGPTHGTIETYDETIQSAKQDSDKQTIEAVSGKGFKFEERIKDEELVELSTMGKERKLDEAKVQRTIAANEDKETQEQNEKPNVLSDNKASGTEVSHEMGLMDIANVTQVTNDTQGLEKTSLAITHEQIASKTDPKESIETTNSTACIDEPLMQADITAEAFRKVEIKDLKAGYASGSEPEEKGIECGEETRMGKESEETTEKSTMIESAKISLSDLLQRSTKQTLQAVEHMVEERELTGNKEEQQTETAETVQVEEAKTDENKDDEEEGDEHLGSDAPVMVESSKDMDVIKTAHKKSHNILSGVGSKVKHSLAKVKKVITGHKSSHPKPPSPK